MNQDYIQILAAAVNSTANATANAANVAEPAAAIQLYGGMSFLMLIEGALTYNAYTTFISTLSTNNVTSKTLWTTAWLQASTPLAGWFYLAKAVIALNAISVFGFLLQMAGMGNAFFRFTQFGLMWPLIEIPLVVVAYTNYSACSTLTSSNFAGTTDTSQYSSCTGGSAAEYGDAGSIAVKVNDDPYTIWTAINGLFVFMHVVVTYSNYPKFATYYLGMMDQNEGPPETNNQAYDEEWQESQEFGTPAPETGAEAKQEQKEEKNEPEADWGNQNSGWGNSGGWGNL